jgi:uncharacterized repeat protein (TIGR01451 family)
VIVYVFTVTNTGTVNLSGVTVNPASLSLNMPGFSCTPISLAVGQVAQLVCTGNTYTITPADVATGQVILSGDATGTSPSGQTVTDPSSAPVVPLALGGLTITKTAGVSTVQAGGLVPYTITVTNSVQGLPVTVDVTDTLPAGLVFKAGSASVAGVAASPAVAGQSLTFAGVSIAPGGSVQISLSALVAGSVKPGSYINRAQVFNPLSGLALSLVAEAVVKVRADPVFSCGTVIGHVFEDPNQDGYMNARDRSQDGAITDQTYHSSGKFEIEPEQFGDVPVEKGLPNVRLVAPNGDSVRTDAHQHSLRGPAGGHRQQLHAEAR